MENNITELKNIKINKWIKYSTGGGFFTLENTIIKNNKVIMFNIGVLERVLNVYTFKLKDISLIDNQLNENDIWSISQDNDKPLIKLESYLEADKDFNNFNKISKTLLKYRINKKEVENIRQFCIHGKYCNTLIND